MNYLSFDDFDVNGDGVIDREEWEVFEQQQVRISNGDSLPNSSGQKDGLAVALVATYENLKKEELAPRRLYEAAAAHVMARRLEMGAMVWHNYFHLHATTRRWYSHSQKVLQRWASYANYRIKLGFRTWRRWLRRAQHANQLDYNVLLCHLNRTLSILQQWRSWTATRRPLENAARADRHRRLNEAVRTWRDWRRASTVNEQDMAAHAAGHEASVLRRGLVSWQLWWLGLRDEELLGSRAIGLVRGKAFAKWRRKQQVRSRLRFLDELSIDSYAERVSPA